MFFKGMSLWVGWSSERDRFASGRVEVCFVVPITSVITSSIAVAVWSSGFGGLRVSGLPGLLPGWWAMRPPGLAAASTGLANGSCELGLAVFEGEFAGLDAWTMLYRLFPLCALWLWEGATI